MIFSNKINKVVWGLALVIICICVVGIYDVNNRLPNAVEVTNDENNCIYWKGCRVKAMEKELYSVEEYNLAYPADMSYQYLAERDTTGYGIVLYRVEVTNENDSAVKFSLPAQAVAAAFPSTWHNGISMLSGESRIEPGEAKVMEGTALYAPSLVHFTKLNDMKNNEFQLIFSFYPERVLLKFD